MSVNPLTLLVLQVENIVAAEYELEHLLLEGHCFDVSSGQPPRGLQFTLGSASEPVIMDTIVMANLVSYKLFLHLGAGKMLKLLKQKNIGNFCKAVVFLRDFYHYK